MSYLEKNNIQIRFAVEEDFAVIKSIHLAMEKLGLFERGRFVNSSIQDAISKQRIFVARNSHGIIAYAEFKKTKAGEIEIKHIFVAKRFRNNGIAKALIDTIADLTNAKEMVAEAVLGAPNNTFYEQYSVGPPDKIQKGSVILNRYRFLV